MTDNSLPAAAGSIQPCEQQGVASFAESLFDACTKYLTLDDELTNRIMTICGCDANDPDTWFVYSDITHDWYDASFEIKGADNAMEFTDDQVKQFWSLGFRACWICHQDGSEHRYSIGGKSFKAAGPSASGAAIAREAEVQQRIDIAVSRERESQGKRNPFSSYTTEEMNSLLRLEREIATNYERERWANAVEGLRMPVPFNVHAPGWNGAVAHIAAQIRKG